MAEKEDQPPAITTGTSTTEERPSSATLRLNHRFLVVWLDANIDEVNSQYCADTLAKLRQTVGYVKTFTSANECVDFMTDVENKKVLIICSDAFAQEIISVIQEMPQVFAMYILCDNKVEHERLTRNSFKLKGVFADVILLCQALMNTVQARDRNSISISIIGPTEPIVDQDLNQLDQSFMYTQLLKQILLAIDFNEQHLHDFVKYCRELYVNDHRLELRIDKVEREYYYHTPIWWYTGGYIFYSMLNRALRLMEIDCIINMGFFTADLHRQILELHRAQYANRTDLTSITVYRGQILSQQDFDRLIKSKGGLLSFNNFLSTSTDREVSLMFAHCGTLDDELVGILFVLNVGLSISSIPFANVGDSSFFSDEEEVLFSMTSVFRIGEIKQLDENDLIYEVSLTLTSDEDPQLRALTDRIREETNGPTGWHRLGKLLIRLNQLDRAEKLYKMLLEKETNELSKADLLDQLGWIKDDQGKYAEAITLHKKSIEIKEKILPPTHIDMARSYGNIGAVYFHMSDYPTALSYYEKDLEISEKSLVADHPNLATSHNNIGLAYANMEKYSNALLHYDKAVEIFEKNPLNHPNLATTYNNIGLVHEHMNDDFKAMSYFEKALTIRQRVLLPNHPDLATSYNNIGGVYSKMSEHLKAVLFYKRGMNILRETLPANHPNLATSYSNIGLLYETMNEYSKALEYYERELEILQSSLPPNYLSLIASYKKIAQLYEKMGDFAKAFSYSKKAIEVLEQCPPSNST